MKLPEPQIESAPQLPRDPIIRSFRNQIADKHREGKKADAALKKAFLLKLNVARETGSLIEQAKGTLKESEFKAATDFLGSEAVRTYLKFHRLHESPIVDVAAGLRSIAIAMMTTGLLPFPDGHGLQHLHEPNFFSAAETLIQTLAARWTKFARLRPPNSWRYEQLESFHATLTPIERIVKAVAAELKRKEENAAQ